MEAKKHSPSDGERYRRLRVLGIAPYGTDDLKNGTVLRFTNLDDFIDKDLAHYSRGEVPTDAANNIERVEKERDALLIAAKNALYQMTYGTLKAGFAEGQLKKVIASVEGGAK